MRRILLAALVAAILGGCAGHARTVRVADVEAGDYYTTEEIKGLTQEERDRYCAALDARILALREEASGFDMQADSLSAVLDSLRTSNAQLTGQIRELDDEIRQLRLARRAASIYIVKAGDTFPTISSAVFGTPDRWKEIYEANKGLVKGPAMELTPGMRLTIPSN